MKLAPIVIFVYNRPWHTRQTLQALSKNFLAEQSELIVFSDGPKNDPLPEDLKRISEVRNIVKERTWCKSVRLIESDTNKGLKRSIIDGVTEIVNQYERIIVLEDDLITSPYFLTYLNDALNLYENEEQVASINAYLMPVKGKIPDTFFLSCGESWGWGTWKRAWSLFVDDSRYLIREIDGRNLRKEFDFGNSYPFYEMLKAQAEGKLSTWCIKWYASMFLRKKLTLYPGFSLIDNIGCDGSGTHFTGSDKTYHCFVDSKPVKLSIIPVIENKEMRKQYSKFFRKHFSEKNKIIGFFKLRIKRFIKPKNYIICNT